jgi:hypothetical protein
MKHLIKNNQIVMSGIPGHFTRESGEGFWGGYDERTDLHYTDGWRDEVVPEYDPIMQKLGKVFYDVALDAVTYPVKARTDLPTLEEAKNRKLREIKRMAKDLLDETDFYAIRKAETGKAIPAEVIIDRQTIRAKADELELIVSGITILRDVLAYEVIF